MLPYALLSLSMLALRQAPVGTHLHIRLTSPVGSFGSSVGSAVTAVLIAPVVFGGETLIPLGSTLSGTVTRAQKVGFGIIHETATLGLSFNEVQLPDGTTVPVGTRLSEVDNSRERVVKDGTIRGVRSTSSISYRASGYIRTVLCWEIHARLAFWAVRTLLVQVPEPEIYYPAGSELTLALTGSWVPPAGDDVQPADNQVTHDDRYDLEQLTADMPFRAFARGKKNRPSDLINVVFIGSHDEIADAFEAAGWTETKPQTWRSRIQGMRALAESRNFGASPMSSLLVDDAPPDMAWQKGLNDIAKRHHIRIWKRSEKLNGQEVWVGTATRDVDFAYFRPGQAFTHRIEANVDEERDKIAHDLRFTTCADAVDWWNRPGAPRSTHNATGDVMNTDGRLAVIHLSDCVAPPRMLASDAPVIRAHGNCFQRLVRRQILSVRSDFYRRNMYWRSYEVTRWAISAFRKNRRLNDPSLSGPGSDRSDTETTSLFARARNSSWFR